MKYILEKREILSTVFGEHNNS